MSDEMKVKRFAPAHAIYIAESRDGGFVRFSDYTALERRARIAERIQDKLETLVSFKQFDTARVEATREIDAELAKEQR